MVPGSNLLSTALTIIASQSVVYYRADGRILNNVGQDVTSYLEPQLIYGSFQPVPRSLYEKYGLDFQKIYYTFYTTSNLVDVQRNVSNDYLVFGNLKYNCESNNDWFAMDGWKGVLCCQTTEPGFPDAPTIGFNEIPEINDNTNFNQGNYNDGQ